jgi:FtsZ-interacting cell division protein ZipA
MAALRWILLLVGMLFLLSLAAWELQRSRRARRLERADGGRRAFGGAEPFAAEADVAASPEPQRVMEAEEAVELEVPQHSMDPPETEALAGNGRIEPLLIDPSLSEPSAAIEATPPLRVEWPDERARRIFAVRIVAASGERLSGRAVRQALGACGFVHGPFRIYHQPAADGRALLSCANLTQPGDFDPLTLDFQRLTGLSLFSVLPGPAPAAAALEHLLETADDLAQRLRAELTDERGAPLDAARVEVLRASAQEWTASKSQAPGAESTRGA